MNNVKVTFSAHLSDHQHDFIKGIGFITEKQDVYSKVYEISECCYVASLFSDLMIVLDIEPYKMEINKLYFTDGLDKWKYTDYNRLC